MDCEVREGVLYCNYKRYKYSRRKKGGSTRAEGSESSVTIDGSKGRSRRKPGLIC